MLQKSVEFMELSKQLLKGARTAIKTCLNVKRNEKVLILTDTGRDFRIARALFEVAVQVKSDPIIIVMTQRQPGEEPPSPVVEAMKAADAVACPTTTTMYHTDARTLACEAGARIIALTGCTLKTLMTGPITVDFVKQRPMVEKLASLLTMAKSITLTTPSGTHLTASIEGRVGNAETGLCHERGRCVGVPNIEANISPIEGTTEGKLVVDGSVSVIPGIVKEKIELTIEGGRAREITGGTEGTKLREILEKTNDPKAYVVAEFGVGFNPKAKVRGVVIEDEASLGTAHVALGDNHRMGGRNVAAIHIDSIVRKPTIELDGKVVFKEKRLIV